MEREEEEGMHGFEPVSSVQRAGYSGGKTIFVPRISIFFPFSLSLSLSLPISLQPLSVIVYPALRAAVSAMLAVRR